MNSKYPNLERYVDSNKYTQFRSDYAGFIIERDYEYNYFYSTGGHTVINNDNDNLTIIEHDDMSLLLKTALFYWSGCDKYESTVPINFSYGRIEFMDKPNNPAEQKIPGVSLTGYLTIDWYMTECLPVYKRDLQQALYDLTGYTWDILQSWHEDTRETMPGYNVYWVSLWTDGNHS